MVLLITYVLNSFGVAIAPPMNQQCPAAALCAIHGDVCHVRVT
jgi:hypothetical protein